MRDGVALCHQGAHGATDGEVALPEGMESSPTASCLPGRSMPVWPQSEPSARTCTPTTALHGPQRPHAAHGAADWQQTQVASRLCGQQLMQT